MSDPRLNLSKPFVKWVGRWSPEEKVLRLFRVVWCRGTPGTASGGYSAKFSVSLSPRLFSVRREFWSYAITLLGLRLHYMRSYGGYIV
jgi:hypothetical protein